MLKINIAKTIALPLVIIISFVVLAGVALSQSLSTGYKSETPLQKGMLVTEKEDDPNVVEPVTQDTLANLKGVVVQQNDSPVTLSGEGDNVFVADTGEFEVLVSDENGQVAVGDYVSISSLAGVSMKANEDQAIVLGRATVEFKGEGDSLGSTLDDRTGRTIQFGRIPVSISIATNPSFRDAKSNSIPKILERISVSVAGKPVNTSRIWMATAVFLGSMLITGVMLYSGSRGSLISVGRNPLSKSAILKGLVQVVVLSLVVFISGMFAVYLLLRV